MFFATRVVVGRAELVRASETLEHVQRIIVLLRGQRVILDSNLAALYGVQNRVLLQAVKRNIERFPADFMFQLTREEAAILRSQTVILRSQASETINKSTRGSDSLPHGQHAKYLPYAFTEQGVAMLSTVLRSQRAIDVNIEIMRAFVRLRRLLAEHSDLAARLDELEKRYDEQFRVVFDAIRELMAPQLTSGKRIGFRREED